MTLTVKKDIYNRITKFRRIRLMEKNVSVVPQIYFLLFIFIYLFITYLFIFILIKSRPTYQVEKN